MGSNPHFWGARFWPFLAVGKANFLKKPKVTETFRPHCAQPKVYPRHLEQIDGKRVDRRPSKLAAKQGKKRITDCEWADEFVVDGGWSEDDEQMPDEYAEEDTGWRAGPNERDLPAFNGRLLAHLRVG